MTIQDEINEIEDPQQRERVAAVLVKGRVKLHQALDEALGTSGTVLFTEDEVYSMLTRIKDTIATISEDYPFSAGDLMVVQNQLQGKLK